MSSSSTLFDLSVPVYIRALQNLTAILKKGEQWASDNNVSKETLLETKIADDMKPLAFQIQACSNTSKFVAVRLGGLENAVFEDNETTFEQLYERIEKTVAFLKKAEAKAFVGVEGKEVQLMGKFKFTGLSYLQEFATPNFFFHESMAYAILRKAGVPVGKWDYLGSLTPV